jgi:hypothetical protein
MVAVIFYLGLSPQPVIDTARPALDKTLEAKDKYLLIKPESGIAKPDDKNIYHYVFKVIK